MAQAGAGFAGFATWFDMTPADPDILAIPDPDSLIQLPWKPEVGWVAGGSLMGGDAGRAGAAQCAETRRSPRPPSGGSHLKTGVECEYLPDLAGWQRNRRRRRSADKPCYDQQALMRRYDVIAEICDAMLALGWKPYQNDHEDANGQFEMNWEYDDALVTADRHAFFKFMVKSIAEKHGLRATFMPKPFADLTGSGCHAHVSLWQRRATTCSPTRRRAWPFAAGYQLHRRHDDSCRGTLRPDQSDGEFATSGSTHRRRCPAPPGRRIPSAMRGNNRTHMIRIPDAGRFELRLADGATNPYLLQAAIAGRRYRRHGRGAIPANGSTSTCTPRGTLSPASERLPLNLLDALRALESSETLAKAFGAEFTHAYVRLKRAQWDEYSRHLTQWERDTTLDI